MMSLLFKNYSLVKVVNLLIRFNKTNSFLRNTKNTDRNGINGQNAYTTHREKDNFRQGQLVLGPDNPLLLEQPPILPTPPFWGNFENSTHLLCKGGILTMTPLSSHTNSRELKSKLKRCKQKSKKDKHQIRNKFTIKSF